MFIVCKGRCKTLWHSNQCDRNIDTLLRYNKTTRENEWKTNLWYNLSILKCIRACLKIHIFCHSLLQIISVCVLVVVVCNLNLVKAGWLSGPSGPRKRQASPTRMSRTTSVTGTAASPVTTVTAASPVTTVMLCGVNATETTATTVEECTNPSSLEDFVVRQKGTKKMSGSLSVYAKCQWQHVDNIEEDRYVILK